MQELVAGRGGLHCWFTRHFFGRFLLGAVESQLSKHEQASRRILEEDRMDEQGERKDALHLANHLNDREEFLETYCSTMRAYDPPFLLVRMFNLSAADASLGDAAPLLPTSRQVCGHVHHLTSARACSEKLVRWPMSTEHLARAIDLSICARANMRR